MEVTPKMKFGKSTFLFLTAVVCLACLPYAVGQTQTTADVTGTVKDSSGAVVPAAVVTLTHVETKEVRMATTSAKGEFHFSLVPPGECSLSAVSSSLKSNIEKFMAQVGQVQEINLTVKVQATQEIIEVSGETILLQAENANLATSVSTKDMQELPVAGGDLTTVAMTVPGVRVNVKGGSGNMNADGVPGSTVLFTLNGAAVMDPYNNLNNSGASNNLLGQGEIAEAAVILNPFSAEYGTYAGGQVNLTGKSGTNAYHVNLLYNYNDAKFNANSFFANRTGTPRGRADANEWTASGGGPVIKNKLFFFQDWESLRYAIPSSGVVTVPTPQFESYVMTHIPTASVPLYTDAFNLWNGAPGLNRAQPVTTGTGSYQDSTGDLGCQSKGTFNGTLLGAAGGPYFGTVKGVPGVPCAQAFGTNVAGTNRESLVITRVDWNINEKEKVSFRYEYDWGVQPTATSPLSAAFNSISVQPQPTGQMNVTSILTPRLTNSFMFNASYYVATFGVVDFTGDLAKMPAIFTFSDGGSNGGGAFATVGAGFPNGRNVGQGQLSDDLAWQKGSHNMKVGVYDHYNKLTITSNDSTAFIGTYSFSDLTDFANGVVNKTGKGDSFSQGFPILGAAHIRENSIGFYGQDEWAVTQRIKVTAGIRFESSRNPYCVDLCMARVEPQFGTAGYTGGASIPYNATIQTGLGNAFQNIDGIITEPRFGIAIRPFGKLVIRGGVGLFSSLFAGSIANSIFGNPPDLFKPTVSPAVTSASFPTVDVASDPTSAAAVAQSSYNAFLAGFKGGETLAQLKTAVAPATFALPALYSPPDNFHAPRVLEWNFQIEQPIGNSNVASLTYTGNHGYNEQLTNADANSFYSPTNYPNGFGGLPSAAPDPRFLTVSQVVTSGVSNYDAMILQIRHSWKWGFSGQIGWTWSHALGTIAIYNPYNINLGYGNEGYDTRHMVTGDLVWNSPRLSNHALNAVVGGWVVGTKMFIYSGSPFSVTNSSMAARVNSAGGVGNTFLADVINPSVLGTHCTTANINTQCITAASFATTATQADFGNAAPDSFWGTGYFDIDTQITKAIPIKEKYKFELGMSFYNLLNHPNFASPSGSVTSAGLGLITATVGPPTSIYGSFEGASVSGRVAVLVGKFSF
jgi:hypothetical protein